MYKVLKSSLPIPSSGDVLWLCSFSKATQVSFSPRKHSRNWTLDPWLYIQILQLTELSSELLMIIDRKRVPPFTNWKSHYVFHWQASSNLWQDDESLFISDITILSTSGLNFHFTGYLELVGNDSGQCFLSSLSQLYTVVNINWQESEEERLSFSPNLISLNASRFSL